MAKGRDKNRSNRPRAEKPEFDQQILDLARVTRVTKGGKQLSFRATVLIGDHRGRVGYGVDKGKDVQIAVDKAVNQARKTLFNVPIVRDTIPHTVMAKYGAARVLIQPAPRGSGIIAGGAIRLVLELAGVPNASAKMLGRASNKMNNIKATFDALHSFKVKAKVFKPVEKKEAIVSVEKSQEKSVEEKKVVK